MFLVKVWTAPVETCGSVLQGGNDWANGRRMDVTRCSNDFLSCLETHPRSKIPRPEVSWCFGLLNVCLFCVCVCVCVCVFVWACSHAWWHTNRYQFRLSARLLLRKGLSHHPSPPTMSHFFTFSCLPLAPPFTFFALLPLSLTTEPPNAALTAWEHFPHPERKGRAGWDSRAAVIKSREVKKQNEKTRAVLLFCVSSFSSTPTHRTYLSRPVSLHLLLSPVCHGGMCAEGWQRYKEPGACCSLSAPHIGKTSK